MKSTNISGDLIPLQIKLSCPGEFNLDSIQVEISKDFGAEKDQDDVPLALRSTKGRTDF